MFLRFDCYCNIFYHQSQFLFDGIDYIRNKSFRPFILHPTIRAGPRNREFETSGIIDAIFQCHKDLLKQLDHSLRSRQPKPLKRHERWKRDVLTLGRNQFLYRRSAQQWCYIFRLCIDRYPRIFFLQSLTPEDFEHYTLEGFYQIITTKPKTEDWSERPVPV
jgi:hypothetical protein